MYASMVVYFHSTFMMFIHINVHMYTNTHTHAGNQHTHTHKINQHTLNNDAMFIKVIIALYPHRFLLKDTELGAPS